MSRGEGAKTRCMRVIFFAFHGQKDDRSLTLHPIPFLAIKIENVEEEQTPLYADVPKAIIKRLTRRVESIEGHGAHHECRSQGAWPAR